MPPSDREFGRLEGKVDGLSQRIEDFQRANDADHATVVASLTRIEEKFSAALEKRDERIDSLESTRDKGGFIGGMVGAVLSLLALLISGKGHA